MKIASHYAASHFAKENLYINSFYNQWRRMMDLEVFEQKVQISGQKFANEAGNVVAAVTEFLKVKNLDTLAALEAASEDWKKLYPSERVSIIILT